MHHFEDLPLETCRLLEFYVAFLNSSSSSDLVVLHPRGLLLVFNLKDLLIGRVLNLPLQKACIYGEAPDRLTKFQANYFPVG